MVALVAEFMPAFLVAPFAPFVETLTGVEFNDFSGVKLGVYVIAFILLYYIFEVRLSGIVPTLDGARTAEGVVNKVQRRVNHLLREYRDMFIAIATALGIWAVISTGALGQTFAAFIDATFAQSPAWFGWVGTLVAGYANFVSNDLGLDPTLFGLVMLAFLAFGLYVEYEVDTN